MDVDVVDRLVAVFAGIDHGAIAPCQSFGAGNLGCCPMQMAKQGNVFPACAGDGGNVLARNDEDVRRRLRIDVRKGVAEFILVDGLRRDASINDLAEEAVHGSERVYTWTGSGVRYSQGSENIEQWSMRSELHRGRLRTTFSKFNQRKL